MTSYRCAACGSSNVMKDVQAGDVSYDYKKGIIGTVILGPGGAVAGIGSEPRTVYKCSDCGMCLTYAMPEDLRQAIDLGVDNASIRDKLHLINSKNLSWSRLKQLYKNIESGSGDQQLERETSLHRNSLLSYANASQDAFDNAVDVLVEYEEKMERYPKFLTLMEYYVWQDALFTFIENAAKYISKTPPENYRGLYLGRQNKTRPNDQARRLLAYFFTYFVIKAYDKYEKPLSLADLRSYAEEDPFILWFENWFFPHYFVSWGQTDGSIVPWDLDDFLWISGRSRKNGPKVLACKAIFTKISGDQERIFYLPAYAVKNGVLGSWLFTLDEEVDFEQLMKDYFRFNPEQQNIFDRKITEFKASNQGFNAEIKKLENRIAKLNTLVSMNESSIDTKRSQIETLRRKIFGKKAARAEADELEQGVYALLQENENHAKEIADSKTMISTLKIKVQRAKEETPVFYNDLIKEMDYFIIWRWHAGESKEEVQENE
ncbi:MAG: hypothetical protein IJN20_05355 [Oscillospiraceae bacterium]|nr:hypothetical protein [Oscillospiraceae bacterium]